MFVPPMYRADDLTWIRELITNNPLATLVTAVGGKAIASHVPVTIQSVEDGQERLTLAGHMNRQNPQWEMVANGGEGLLIFTGPHGYVSPTVYGFTPAAPTWNFTAVHASGPLSAVPAGISTLDIVKATVRAFEGRFGTGWDMSDSLDYINELLPGVAAFSMPVERLESMRKLSQEQLPLVRERVADAFAARGCDCRRDLVDMMRRSLAVEDWQDSERSPR